MAAALACSSSSPGTDGTVAPRDTTGEAGVLVPKAAAGSRLILQDDLGALFLWDGREGDAVPLDLGPDTSASTVLIGGPADDLLLLWDPIGPAFQGTLTLLNLSSGERRLLADDARPRAVMTSSKIVWSDPDGLVQIWEMDRDLKTVLEATRTAPAEGLAVANGLIAWSSRADENVSSEIHVIDLETGERDLIEATGLVQHVVLTDDGAYLAWMEEDGAQPGFYAMDRESGQARRFLDDSDGMTITGLEESNGFVAWRADSGSGGIARPGYYDLANDRLQFIEPEDGRSVFHSGVLGDWFFWVEAEEGDGDAVGPPEVFLRPLR